MTHGLSHEQAGINNPFPNGPIRGADCQECQVAADTGWESDHFANPMMRRPEEDGSLLLHESLRTDSTLPCCPREGLSVQCSGLTEFVRLIALGQAVST